MYVAMYVCSYVGRFGKFIKSTQLKGQCVCIVYPCEAV